MIVFLNDRILIVIVVSNPGYLDYNLLQPLVLTFLMVVIDNAFCDENMIYWTKGHEVKFYL